MSFISSFELLLVYILDKRIGKELIVKPLPDYFLVNSIFFILLRNFTYKSTYLPYFFLFASLFSISSNFSLYFFSLLKLLILPSLISCKKSCLCLLSNAANLFLYSLSDMSLSFNSFLSSCIFCSNSLFSVFNLLSDMPLSFNSFSISCIFYLCLRSNIPNSFLYSSSNSFLSFNSCFIFCFSLFNS